MRPANKNEQLFFFSFLFFFFFRAARGWRNCYAKGSAATWIDTYIEGFVFGSAEDFVSALDLAVRGIVALVDAVEARVGIIVA